MSFAETAAFALTVARITPIPCVKHVASIVCGLAFFGPATVAAFLVTLAVWRQNEHGNGMRTDEFWKGVRR